MLDKNDILQIRKYLNGELNARAMHELEKRALDDPFLMEALEGYEQIGVDQQANLKDISSRLQERVEDKKVKRIIPWMPLSIAASILIIIGVGIFFLTGDKSKKQPQIAQVVLAPEQKRLTDTAPVTAKNSQTEAFADKSALEKKNAAIPQRGVVPNSIVRASVPDATVQPAQQYSSGNASPVMAEPVANADINSAYKPHKDSVSVDEAVVSNYKAKKRDTSSTAYKSTASAPMDKLLKSRADGVTVTPIDNFGQATHVKTLNGIVIGRDDGQPITGATVKVVGAKFGAVTDVNGRFALPNVGDNQTLSVGYIGYNGQKVNVSTKDSVKIQLQPVSNSLAEVVVTRPVVKHHPQAHPSDGWKALEAYLNKNAVSTDGQTGKVKVSFTVSKDGSLSNFKIIKSLSAIADQKAIELIQYGDPWVGNADGTSKEVTVSVKFH